MNRCKLNYCCKNYRINMQIYESKKYSLNLSNIKYTQLK